MKRSIVIDGIGTELILSKVTCLNVEKKMIELTELPDGTWRLIYSKSVIPEIKDVQALRIVRED